MQNGEIQGGGQEMAAMVRSLMAKSFNTPVTIIQVNVCFIIPASLYFCID